MTSLTNKASSLIFGTRVMPPLSAGPPVGRASIAQRTVAAYAEPNVIVMCRWTLREIARDSRSDGALQGFLTASTGTPVTLFGVRVVLDDSIPDEEMHVGWMDWGK